jgi:hypothetical protein
MPATPGKIPAHENNGEDTGSGSAPLSSLDEEFRQQQKVNAPEWKKWVDKQIETSIGDMRQLSNETVIAYSVLNSSDRPVEIVPTQIQITGRMATKKKKKEGKGIISDQLEIRDYRLSATRLEPGGRADGVVVFDRPNFDGMSRTIGIEYERNPKAAARYRAIREVLERDQTTDFILYLTANDDIL